MVKVKIVSKKKKVKVKTSKAHRHKSHKFLGIIRKGAKPHRHKAKPRRPRSTKKQIKERGGTRKNVERKANRTKTINSFNKQNHVKTKNQDIVKSIKNAKKKK